MISGSPSSPGLVFLLMKDLFDRISSASNETQYEISISYLEVYNETIRDLLAPGATSAIAGKESGGVNSILNLRESEGKAYMHMALGYSVLEYEATIHNHNFLLSTWWLYRGHRLHKRSYLHWF